jgi:hypothetical protein
VVASNGCHSTLLLKLQVYCVDLCAINATGIGQHVHKSGFIICKPYFKFRMSIAQLSTFIFAWPLSIRSPCPQTLWTRWLRLPYVRSYLYLLVVYFSTHSCDPVGCWSRDHYSRSW